MTARIIKFSLQTDNNLTVLSLDSNSKWGCHEQTFQHSSSAESRDAYKLPVEDVDSGNRLNLDTRKTISV